MQLNMQRAAMAGMMVAGVAWISAAGQSQQAVPAQEPSVTATRLYTGTDGQSHIDQVSIALTVSSGVRARADSKSQAANDAFVVRGAPGMFETWHNADKKRYIVVLSGAAEVTTTDGEKARIVPGHLYIAEDLTGKGHTFRVIGNQEWVALFVNFAQ